MYEGIERRKEKRRSCEVETNGCAYESELKQMHKAIYGNGSPEHGLLWMVSENTKFIKTVSRIFWPCLIAAMIGSGAAVVNLLVNSFIHLHGGN